MRRALSLALLALAVGCGRASESENKSSEGGAGIEAGSPADVAVTPSEAYCQELFLSALNALSPVVQANAACQSNSDCILTTTGYSGWCVAPCGVATNAAGAGAVIDAAVVLCKPFLAAGCNPDQGCPASTIVCSGSVCIQEYGASAVNQPNEGEAGVEGGSEAVDATIMDAASEAMPEASLDSPVDSMGTVDAGSDAAAETGGDSAAPPSISCAQSLADYCMRPATACVEHIQLSSSNTTTETSFCSQCGTPCSGQLYAFEDCADGTLEVATQVGMASASSGVEVVTYVYDGMTFDLTAVIDSTSGGTSPPSLTCLGGAPAVLDHGACSVTSLPFECP